MESDRTCANGLCFKRAEYQCMRCKNQWYCSRKCQTTCWMLGHKSQCKDPAQQEAKQSDSLNEYMEMYSEQFMVGLHEVSTHPSKFLILQSGNHELRTLKQIQEQLEAKFPSFWKTVKTEHALADGNVSVFILQGKAQKLNNNNNNNTETKEQNAIAEHGKFYRIPSFVLESKTVEKMAKLGMLR
jgi:hypothetical protein